GGPPAGTDVPVIGPGVLSCGGGDEDRRRTLSPGRHRAVGQFPARYQHAPVLAGAESGACPATARQHSEDSPGTSTRPSEAVPRMAGDAMRCRGAERLDPDVARLAGE